MELEIESRSDDAGQITLAVAGAIDLQSRDDLIDAARDALKSGTTSIVLNLAAVDFMDSTGIGALVEISREASDAGVDFAIQEPSERVLRILEITGLTQAWNIA